MFLRPRILGGRVQRIQGKVSGLVYVRLRLQLNAKVCGAAMIAVIGFVYFFHPTLKIEK